MIAFSFVIGLSLIVVYVDHKRIDINIPTAKNAAIEKYIKSDINRIISKDVVELEIHEMKKPENHVIAPKNTNMSKNAKFVEGNITCNNKFTSKYNENNNDNDIEIIITKDDKSFHNHGTQYF